MKYTPELLFHLDTSADEAQRLEEILHRIESESPPSAGEEEAGEGDR